VVDYIRLDSDELDPPKSTTFGKVPEDDKETKGIHFNAKRLKDDAKMAFSIRPTKAMQPKDREKLYMSYVNQIQKVGATELWKIWSTGNVSAMDEYDEDEEEEY
jgi:hypothetical protein